MRRARLTYPGAWHHVMNRGHEGKPIFRSEREKSDFLTLLNEAVTKYRIRLTAWCVMSNHYHLILQNTTGRLSEFVKFLNAAWARKYRTHHGGKGYVFQGRFKSTVVEEEEHLETAICYVLLNPVRAGISKTAWDYKYSSIHGYFGRLKGMTDNDFVKGIYPERSFLDAALAGWEGREIPVRCTRMGAVLGDRYFEAEATARYNRRMDVQESLRKRKEENHPEAEKVSKKLEQEEGIRLDELETRTFAGKRVRARLLVRLREEAGMTYAQIIRMPLFRELKYSALGSIYRNAKRRC
jgi:REP element-mobilizing transposase RayT